MILGVTGHRPDKLGGWRWNNTHAKVYQDLRRAIRHLQPTYLITGMALGVDQWAAEVAIEMNLPFIAAVPFDGQESVWPDSSKAKYRQILTKAFRTYVISPGAYEPWKMAERNKWIVNNCEKLLAVWDGSQDGGTSHCVNYAQRIGREIFYIDPNQPLVIQGEDPTASAGLVQQNANHPTHQTHVSQTAAELIARTRASRPAAAFVIRTQTIGPARSPNQQNDQPAGPNPYKRILDID